MAKERGVGALNGREFDVLVVGGGVNGAASAQHLAAAGYSVLLIEKNDFASGSSSRSSRSLGNGMHYLALGHSPWDVLRRPMHFLAGCGMARSALRNRAQFVQETPDRLAQTDFVFPIIEGEAYKAWHFDVGVAMLRLLGTGGQKLNYRRISGEKSRNMPIVEWMREPAKISSVVMMDHFLFRSPERIVIDTVLDAVRLGATALNYATLTGLQQLPGSGWNATITDTIPPAGTPRAKATVKCGMVFNMTGIWIDEVNSLAPQQVPQLIAGTKGVHVMLRLPEKCRNRSCTWYNRRNEHMYILPWGDLHYLGPTETPYEGSVDDIRPTEADVEWIIDEANFWMPGMGLRREHVIFAWAGVRPLTKSYDAKGIRRRILHNLAAQGMDGLYCLTGGPLNSQRSAGQDAVKAAKAYRAPTGPRRQPSYSAKLPPDGRTWQRLENFVPAASVEEVRNAAGELGPRNLVDLMFRRLHLGWSASMGLAEACWVAKAAAETLGWHGARVEQEVAAYADYLATMHLYDVSGREPPIVGSFDSLGSSNYRS
jgi:glycerol-3-phosphate dehydrogenase